MPDSISLPKVGKQPQLLFVSRPKGAEAVVAFIHGLGGHCYRTWGPKGEPATFLRRLALDLPEVTIATYSYPSGARRAFDPSALAVEDLAKVWAHKIRHSLLSRYRTVAILCHSLGGVVTLTALRHLLTNDSDWARRLQDGKTRLALFLMGVPQQGTATEGWGWLSDELLALTYNGELIRGNTEFWQSRVQQPERALEEGDLPVATFAVVSETDKWVPQLSAGANLPESRILRVALSHSQIVKPPAAGDFDPYTFVREKLITALKEPSRRTRGSSPGAAPMPYVDRPAILAADKRAGSAIDRAVDAFGRGAPLEASREFLKAVLVAVGGLENEYDGILVRAAHCSVDQPGEVQLLLDRIDQYLAVTRLKEHLDAAEKGLTRCRRALGDLEPSRERALATGLESLSELIRELSQEGLEFRRARTGVGIEGLWEIRDYLGRADATAEGLRAHVRTAEADVTKDRLATHVGRIREAVYDLVDNLP